MYLVSSSPSSLGAAVAVADDHAVGGALDHDADVLAVVLDVLLELALLDAVERRLRDVDVAALDQLRHVAEEEGEQQRADVRAVDVGVGHQDELAVAQLGGVEVVLADAAAERCDHGADFFVAEHLVVAGLFDVEDLALQREDRLELAVAALLGGAAGRLHPRRGRVRSVSGSRSEQSASLPGRPPPSSAPLRRVRSRALRAASRARAASMALLMIFFATEGFCSRKRAETLVDERLHSTGDVGVQLALGLAFELRLRAA